MLADFHCALWDFSGSMFQHTGRIFVIETALKIITLISILTTELGC